MSDRGSRREDPSGQGLLTIGALSAATGIPIDTIRTWERRYGFPIPERKPSGHRVYNLATIPRLRRAAQAIARGHRAAEVVPASETALEALLDSLPRPAPPTDPSNSMVPSDPSFGTEALLETIRTFDADQLKQRFQTEWARLGPLGFLEHAGAFLTLVGDAWASGELEVRHEHFVSGVLGDFLRAIRSPLENRATGPTAAIATLPGELHGLGLQMAALVFSLAGWRALILGVDTPIAQIAALSEEVPLSVVAVSCVQPLDRRGIATLRALRRRLPRRVQILVGGKGSRQTVRIKGVEFLADLSQLERWLRAWRA